MKVVNLSACMLDQLVVQASGTSRKRQHLNMHMSYDDPVQRLFNAIGPDSYVRPHRHFQDQRTEILLGIRGKLTFVTFDDVGNILESIAFGPQQPGQEWPASVGVEVPPGVWHTVIADEPGSILFEIKAGPFDPQSAKEWAEWAPSEDNGAGSAYLEALRQRVMERCILQSS